MNQSSVWCVATLPDGRKLVYRDGVLVQVVYPPRSKGSYSW